jgi:Polysaccharide lyase family 4, domain II
MKAFFDLISGIPSCLSSCLRGCIFCLLAAVPLISGCDRRRAMASERTAAAGSGVISGRVVLSGYAPLPKILPGSPMTPDESIVVGPEHGLKNVIVYIADAPKATFSQTAPAVLDQINCQYVPHVLAVQTGQTLRIKSSDKVMHDVHLKCAVNPGENFGFPAPGEREVRFASAEAPFPVKCDVHPWMSAWIGVFDHPWFAVTADDGSFTIPRVPPGKYKLVAWQEVLPQQEQEIDVGDGGPTNVQFTFQAP